jgi:hypothetical protein
MTVGSVQAYKQALRSMEAATEQVEAFVEEITHAATILRRWEQVTILNLGIGFPPGAELESINADNWPTSQQLAEALAEWHNCRNALNNAWQAIPETQRTGLQPPLYH